MASATINWVFPIFMLVLLGAPVVVSSFDHLLHLPRLQGIDAYWILTVLSAAVGGIFFVRHLLEPTKNEVPGPTELSSTKQLSRSVSRNGLSAVAEYPQVYITATRPASINVKPMLRLSTEMESFVDRIDKYTDSLESILADRTTELEKNKAQLGTLLQQLLPPSIASRFSAGERVLPTSMDCVTVYYSDIVGYTTIVSQSSALEMVEFLNALYRMTDFVVDKYDAFKVETIGDADLIASGIPVPNRKKHASELARLSLDMVDNFRGFYLPHKPSESLKIRIGLHSGKCMAGIVGTRLPKYVLFGDAVSTATKLECTSEPGRIQISAATAALLRETGDFQLEPRGHINIKGAPKFETFWLNGEN